MVEFLFFATLATLILVVFDAAAVLFGADSRIDEGDFNASRVGIS
jgi:hypothetical protein